MSQDLVYLYDPLCGWCYGAGNVMREVVRRFPDLSVMPAGLFLEGGAHSLDEGVADYIWGHDQRIARLSGAGFSQAYQKNVLGEKGGRLDSWAATLGMTAVAMTVDKASSELEALNRIQTHRYMTGGDVTRIASITELLASNGFEDAANQLQTDIAGVEIAARARADHGRRLMRTFGVEGVPTLVVKNSDRRSIVGASALFGSLNGLMSRLAA